MVSLENNGFKPFIGEDESYYKEAQIIPYYYNKKNNQIQIYLREVDEKLECFKGTIRENEASIIYTITRVLLL